MRIVPPHHPRERGLAFANLVRFLWVEFQLKHLFAQTSAGHLEKALLSLPEDIDRTYDRIVDLINKKPKPQRELARRALLWIAYAQRPLSLRELTAAVAIESDTTSLKAFLPMMPTIETVVDVCSNLISVDNRTVRFVHFSVQEYILSKPRDPDNSSIAALRIGQDLAHLEISRMCIIFGLFCWHPHASGFRYPKFAFYSMNNWMRHVRAVDRINEDLLILILKYFDFGVLFKPLIPSRYDNAMNYEHETQTKFSPSTTALIFDLQLISDHLATSNDDLSGYPDEKYAIHFAARFNSHKAIERLCNRGFTVNVVDNYGKTPIYYATETRTFRCLLNHGANVNAHKGHALVEASRAGQSELVQFLLASGANVKMAPALLYAVTSRNTEITELLLDGGADPNAQMVQYGYPLQAAACHGAVDVVKLLLSRGADVNARGGCYRNALQAAVVEGSQGIVKLLIDHGANVNARKGYYGSALLAATGVSNKDMVQLLLDRGANPYVQGGQYGNALQAAAINRHHEGVAELLLHLGVDVNRRGGYYGNALQAAAARGTEAMLQLLLDHGANVDAEGGHFGTALQAAAAESTLGALKLLLNHGANVNLQGGQCGNALRAAALRGMRLTVKQLLDRGAEVNARGKFYGTALEAAKDLGIKQILIEHGAV